jgi:hypothetical protein
VLKSSYRELNAFKVNADATQTKNELGRLNTF